MTAHLKLLERFGFATDTEIELKEEESKPVLRQRIKSTSRTSAQRGEELTRMTDASEAALHRVGLCFPYFGFQTNMHESLLSDSTDLKQEGSNQRLSTYGVDSFCLDTLYILGIRSDVIRDFKAVPFWAFLMRLLCGISGLGWVLRCITDGRVYSILFGVLPIVVSVFGITNKNTEVLVAKYWRQAPIKYKFLTFILLAAILLGDVIGIISLFTTDVGGPPGWGSDEYPGPVANLSTLGISVTHLLYMVTPCVVIIALCNYIQTHYLDPMDDDPAEWRIESMYTRLSQVKTRTEDVADTLNYYLFTFFWWLFVGLVRSLEAVFSNPSSPTFRQLVNGEASSNRSNGPLYMGLLLIFYVWLVAYPSILIDWGDYKLQNVLCHTDVKQMDYKVRDQILTCLFINVHQSGLFMCGTLIDKEIATLVFRVFYLIVAYLYTQKAS